MKFKNKQQLSMIDLERIRTETAGVESVIHLNNAGSALPPDPVVDAVIDYLRDEARFGGYEVVEKHKDRLSDVYQAASDLIGGAPENWAFVESATRAWNAAFTSLKFSPGDRIITTTSEYPSNMGGLLRVKEQLGVEIDVAPNDKNGQVDVAALQAMITDRTRLVSVVHVPTQSGLINPVYEIGKVLQGTDILYQLDACQSVGQLVVNVDELGCDILSFTGRKFIRGPRGAGMVWASNRALSAMGNPAGVDMSGSTWHTPMEIIPHSNASRFEPYEVFYAGKLGLAVALRYAESIGIDHIQKRNNMLAGSLRKSLAGLPGVSIHDLGVEMSAIVTFTVDNVCADQIKNHLACESINVTTSEMTSAQLDFPERGLTQVVRASVHYYNSEKELEKFIEVLSRLL